MGRKVIHNVGNCANCQVELDLPRRRQLTQLTTANFDPFVEKLKKIFGERGTHFGVFFPESNYPWQRDVEVCYYLYLGLKIERRELFAGYKIGTVSIESTIDEYDVCVFNTGDLYHFNFKNKQLYRKDRNGDQTIYTIYDQRATEDEIQEGLKRIDYPSDSDIEELLKHS